MGQFQNQVIHGDCLRVLGEMDSSSVDLVYMDPPFFTNRQHIATSRDRQKQHSFSDIWDKIDDYSTFMELCLRQAHRVLKDTGSVFVHCDTNANYLLRVLLNDVFGERQFRSEIIWSYRRWSNSAKSLLPAHQTIFFYSKTDRYKFNHLYSDYSETTNIDQILQLRSRDQHGVSVYATDKEGNPVFGGIKKGVPLSDVWEIPFLNPKAKERTGYPTQKPVILLERILEISTDINDLVVDPFCGSGTTLVAAHFLSRRYIGIDISKDAVDITLQRLKTPVKTESSLLKKGRSAYANVNEAAMSVLSGLDLIPVQRNAGIDAFLKTDIEGCFIPIRVQRDNETILEAARKLLHASASKMAKKVILVRTKNDSSLFLMEALPEMVVLVDSTAFSISEQFAKILSEGQWEK